MVSTLDFESNDPGSNPGRTYLAVAQSGRAVDCKSICRVFESPQREYLNSSVEDYLAHNQEVQGSKPCWDIYSFLAQFGRALGC